MRFTTAFNASGRDGRSGLLAVVVAVVLLAVVAPLVAAVGVELVIDEVVVAAGVDRAPGSLSISIHKPPPTLPSLKNTHHPPSRRPSPTAWVAKPTPWSLWKNAILTLASTPKQVKESKATTRSYTH